jgi:hypothetical protein
MADKSTRAIIPTAIPAAAPEDRPVGVVEEAPPPLPPPPPPPPPAEMRGVARLTVEVGDGVAVGVGDMEGATITAGTATAAFTRASGEENPREEAIPDC